MGVQTTSKHDIIERLRTKSLRSTRAEKHLLLDQVVELTGQHRKYALSVLRQGIPIPTAQRAGRRPTYGPRLTRAVRVVAEALALRHAFDHAVAALWEMRVRLHEPAIIK